MLGLDGQPAAIWHGVAGIRRQVGEGRGELDRVRGDRANPGLMRDDDLDVLAQQSLEKLDGVVHQRVEPDRGELERLLAGEGQQLPGQLAAAGGGLQRVGNEFLIFL